ncbi:hypothetical protein ILUMI_11354 [Ignelater luminosus]|uniref:Uncharacterized protein n=1 Tax=Ignelater luminosus TaxID=2038154 RepID=A0A8K0D0E6_IGNLU|nr:hypothetical protein ILUMI_11354 [Ignelater luminosus]
MERKRGSTSANRMKRYRKKRKREDPKYQKKENERPRAFKRKKKETMSGRELEEFRKPDAPSTSNSNNKSALPFYPYKCQQTYGKAVLKSLKSLPSCPLKQKSVIKGVAKRLGLKIIDETEKNENKELEIVKNFYYRPDIVYHILVLE